MGNGFTRIRNETPWPVILVAIAVTFSDTAGQWLVAGGFGLGIDPIGFVLVALAVVVGRPARSGSPVGLLVSGLLLGDWSGGVISAIAGYVATVTAIRLWARGNGDDDIGMIEWLLWYGIVAVAAVFAFAATSAWLSDILGQGAFSVLVGRTIVNTLPLSLLGAPLVRPVIKRVSEAPWRELGFPVTGRSKVLLVGIVVLWTIAGYVGSFLFRAVELAPPGSIGRRVSPVVESFVGLWGWQGVYAQLLLGGIALLLLGLTFRRNSRYDPL